MQAVTDYRIRLNSDWIDHLQYDPVPGDSSRPMLNAAFGACHMGMTGRATKYGTSKPPEDPYLREEHLVQTSKAATSSRSPSRTSFWHRLIDLPGCTILDLNNQRKTIP
ncbi:unnamed protein product [Protopolystoma xenopodis]|uniref:Uncharacterized protein n=1 Tax=Protopolystoma xenopodis TaxID=117903 RepID=A0A448XC55_9PLAT|nr:unnamed protein product [Protopolystoma xenopodis]